MANVHIGAEWEVCLQMGYMCEKDSIFFEMSIHHMLLNHHISDRLGNFSKNKQLFLNVS